LNPQIEKHMKIRYVEVGICGLSCRLCPRYHVDGSSRCGGCKSKFRMGAGCPFITCAVKRKGVEFCGDCEESVTCKKWEKHVGFGRSHDTFVSYQRLEDNITFILKYGMGEFEKGQRGQEKLLTELLREFNEGRSKNYYCIAATVFGMDELKRCIERCREESKGLDIKDRAKRMHAILDEQALKEGHHLKLRK